MIPNLKTYSLRTYSSTYLTTRVLPLLAYRRAPSISGNPTNAAMPPESKNAAVII